MELNIELYGDKILVKPNQTESKTSSGVYIPDNAKEKPNEGIIIAVGDGTLEVPMRYAVGQEVMYLSGGIELTINGDDLVLLHSAIIVGNIKRN
jgi:chaperonin GroES